MERTLADVREYYLACFRESFSGCEGRFDKFAAEVLLEVPSIQHSEEIYRMYRADIIGTKDGNHNVVEVNVSPRLALFASPLQGVTIDAPIVWNGVEFRVTAKELPAQAIIDWATKWIDVSDSRYVESERFQEVAHNVTPPKLTADGYHISVDFGTAPVIAFEELLAILASGSSRVSIGSFFLV